MLNPDDLDALIYALRSDLDRIDLAIAELEELARAKQRGRKRVSQRAAVGPHRERTPPATPIAPSSSV